MVPLKIQSSGPRLVLAPPSIPPPPKAAPKDPSECWINMRIPNKMAKTI